MINNMSEIKTYFVNQKCENIVDCNQFIAPPPPRQLTDTYACTVWLYMMYRGSVSKYTTGFATKYYDGLPDQIYTGCHETLKWL